MEDKFRFFIVKVSNPFLVCLQEHCTTYKDDFAAFGWPPCAYTVSKVENGRKSCKVPVTPVNRGKDQES